MISCKIDVTKIDKTKLFAGKEGAKYLEIILFEVTNSKFGDDFMAVQSVSKEERANGVKGAILGNARVFGKKAPTADAAPAGQEPPKDDDIPF